MESKGDNSDRPRAARFGAFEADFDSGELRKHGLPIKLQGKPLQVLQVLIEQPGRLVTRDQLRQRLWPGDLYVDFDHNLAIAMNKLRAALSDSAEKPRYIETLPRRGYRFIAKVEPVKTNGAGAISSAEGRRLNEGSAASHRAALIPANGDGGAGITAESSVSGPAAVPTTSNEEAQRFDANAALQTEGLQCQTADIGLQLRRRVVARRWALAAALLGGLALGAVVFHSRWWPKRPVIAFHQRDWVLIGQFENFSGEPVLSGTVQYAVTRELSNSSFVSVVSPERVQDALALMKAPAGAPLTRNLAQQVCLRDGGIQALVVGRVEKVGTTYVLSAALLAPTTDTQVAGVEAQAKDLNGILPAVHQLSNQLLNALGETLPAIRAGNQKLEKVTTPSLRALQLYSQAMALAYADPTERPIPLLEQALAEDPNFASAHILLAWCYSNIGKESLAAAHFEKAFQLADTTTERERLFILGSYYQYHLDAPKAVQAYEALLQLYPDDYWGGNNLRGLLLGKEQWEQAAELTAHQADLRPSDFLLNLQAADTYGRMARYSEERRYILRAKSLLTPQIQASYPEDASDLDAYDAESDLRAWDMRAALGETERLAVTYSARPDPERDYLPDDIGGLYLGLGKLRLAEEWFRKVSQPAGERILDFINLDEARGDTAALREDLLRQLADNEQLGPGTAMRLAQLGMLTNLRQVIADMEARRAAPLWIHISQGSLLLAEGRRAQAVPLLQSAVEVLQYFNTSHLGMVADLLATAYDQEGKVSEAAASLRPLEEKHLLDFNASFHLYKLYVKAGDARDAQQVRANLLRRLACADSDYPILIQLQRETSKGNTRVSLLH